MENTTTQTTQPQTNKVQWLTPVAIIIAGALIAFGLYNGKPTTKTADGSALVSKAMEEQDKIEVAPISSVDHIRGDKDADVVFVEYSDIECPFCQSYQMTMAKAYETYGKDKKFAWVYRHFPLSYGKDPLHKNAAKAAEATECVNELAGKDAFWTYLDSVYASIDHNKEGLIMSKLTDIAVKQGVDKTKFQACLDSGKYADKVKESYEAGIKAGARGTPHTIILYKDQQIPLVSSDGKSLGALPYEVVSPIIQELLSKK